MESIIVFLLAACFGALSAIVKLLKNILKECKRTADAASWYEHERAENRQRP